MVKVIKNFDPVTLTEDYDVVLVGTNIYGKLTNGWQLDMKMKYPAIHKANIETGYCDASKMGKVVSVKTETNPVVCLLYINKSCNFRPDLNPEFIDYEALEKCLYRINIEYKGKNIICPILGSSKFDGNGDKNKIIKIFEDTCTDVNVDLYDYKQISAREENLNMIRKIMEAKSNAKETNDWTEYNRLNLKQKEYNKRLKEINNLKI